MPSFRTLSVDLLMAAGVEGADLVHTHTWYANFAGHLARLLYDIPHVATTHSLEPRRPWKAEQLGGGYAVSSFCERTALESADAVIAVSGAMRDDILDCLSGHRPRPGGGDPQRRRHRGVHARPAHRRAAGAGHRPGPALRHLRRSDHPPEGHRPAAPTPPSISTPTPSSCCCPAPPTHPRSARRCGPGRRRWPSSASGVLWLEQVLPRPQLIQVLSNSAVAVCPSVYEPFGLVNVEAMASGTAVVATDVGGIPEIVVDGETGVLVHIELGGGRATRRPGAGSSPISRRRSTGWWRIPSPPSAWGRSGGSGPSQSSRGPRSRPGPSSSTVATRRPEPAAVPGGSPTSGHPCRDRAPHALGSGVARPVPGGAGAACPAARLRARRAGGRAGWPASGWTGRRR